MQLPSASGEDPNSGKPSGRKNAGRNVVRSLCEAHHNVLSTGLVNSAGGPDEARLVATRATFLLDVAGAGELVGEGCCCRLGPGRGGVGGMSVTVSRGYYAEPGVGEGCVQTCEVWRASLPSIREEERLLAEGKKKTGR